MPDRKSIGKRLGENHGRHDGPIGTTGPKQLDWPHRSTCRAHWVERKFPFQCSDELVRRIWLFLGRHAVKRLQLGFVVNEFVAESNDGSIVARLDYGERSFLFTGDAPQSVEKYLTRLDADSLNVDVLKVGHHGSKTSTSAEFLAATTPEVAIISAGKDNRYGHPHQEVLEALAKAGIKILRTDEVGTIVFQSDGTRFWRR